MTKCNNCIWREQCGEADALDCSDYTPFDDSLEIEHYEADLAERQAIYDETLNEMHA